MLEAVDGQADNAPYEPTPQFTHPYGNYVCIAGEHANVFLCHLRRHTVRVVRNRKVVAGEPIGVCGLSGNSSVPHVHCHAQTKSFPFHGIPLSFPADPAAGIELIRDMHVWVRASSRLFVRPASSPSPI